MVQPDSQPDLALEPLRAQGCSDLGMEQLERHWPVVAQVAREVYGGHTATPELALDDVAITECCYQRGVDCGHQICRVRTVEFKRKERKQRPA
jgi:hypothetical protein